MPECPVYVNSDRYEPKKELGNKYIFGTQPHKLVNLYQETINQNNVTV